MLADRLPSASGAGSSAGRPFDPDDFVGIFDEWVREQGIRLYPAQEEAVLELVLGKHLVLSTPTGTGKSLVALAAHAIALAQGQRSWYTAPIKALVSEKFFQLVEAFGAENVGLVTGDSSVNPDAPILCCTAEILANLALRQGAEASADLVVMDEFHYYADPERGWAWQVPLLLLPRAQFLLMSATLGDVTAIADDLERRSGREVAQVTGVARPVPLDYRYVLTPVHETVEQLLGDGLAPIYIVHFSQAAAVERAQALSSAKVATREQRDAIAEELGGFRFAAGFGATLSRLIRAGIGVHHAGMLPKYRRLVEQLAQRGLLRVICGTDTLGVGINVPIRAVLFTGLTKFDGTKMRQLSAREFHQIAGRAGRAGFETSGEVVAEAPEHEIENVRISAKAESSGKKPGTKKRAPEGFVSWGPASFERMIAAVPETLTSSMQLTAAMLINVIGRPGSDVPARRPGSVFANVRSLVFDNHEGIARQRELARRAIGIYRTLRQGGIVEQTGGGFDGSASIRLTVELQPNFALNQPLSPFALAAFELLDPAASSYALDMISVLESTLDDPRQILSQQQFKARGEAVAAMKQEGIEYEQRMELLEEVTWPKPLEELLTQTFEVFATSQPWVRDFELSPKSVVRDLYERAMSFGEFVAFYQLGRSEGLVLRYLSDAFRAARQTIPDDAKTEELRDLIEWLGELVRQVDSSLLDEWRALGWKDEPFLARPAAPAPTAVSAVGEPQPVTANRRAFLVLVRNELWRRVQLAALQHDDELVALDPDAGWPEALDAYFEEHDAIGTGPDARSAARVLIDEGQTVWTVRQILDDPAGDHDWGISAEVDLAASAEQGVAVVRVLGVGRRDG